MQLESLEDVFAAQLAELRSAETQLIDALPRMAVAASDRALQELLVRHHEQTRRHRQRLDVVIRAVAVEVEVPDEDCGAMRALIRDAAAVVVAAAAGDVRDVALIAAARRIEHLEMVSYATACALADELVYVQAARSLRETLGEEHGADERLVQIATGVAA
jgi:ferritin-like metal-binding protein YciE